MKRKRDWSDASASRERPKTARRPPEAAGEARDSVPLADLRRSPLHGHLDRGLAASRAARQISVVRALRLVVPRCGHPRPLTHRTSAPWPGG